MPAQRRARLPADEFLLERVEDCPAARERIGRFLELDHPTLPEFVDLELSEGRILLRRRRREGTPLANVRQSRESAACLLLQAASALVFYGLRGFPLTAEECGEARVELWDGAPHLWLRGTPRSASEPPIAEEPLPASLSALVVQLFRAKRRGQGTPVDPAARKFLEASLGRLRSLRRPDSWVIEVFRHFPFLGEDRFASVRRRCAGFRPSGFDERERRHRARARIAKLRLDGRCPILFVPGSTPLLPGEAVRATFRRSERDGSPRGLAEILEAETRGRGPWVLLDPERWDAASRAAVEAAARRSGAELLEEGARPAAIRPDELRDSVWLPSPDLAASVSLYEALNAAVRRNPACLRRSISRFLGSGGYGQFVRSGAVPEFVKEADPERARADLLRLSREERRAAGIFLVNPWCRDPAAVEKIAGEGAFERAARALAAGGWLFEEAGAGSWRASDASARADLLAAFSPEEVRAFRQDWLPHLAEPALRAEFAAAAGRPDVLREAAGELFRDFDPAARRRRDLDAVSRLAVEVLGGEAPASAQWHEADRLAERGDPPAARAIWERLSADPSAPPRLAGEARMRLAESRLKSRDLPEARCLFSEIAGGLDTEPCARSRALRGLVRVAMAEGNLEEAGRRLAEAEALAGLPEPQILETVLLRADLHSRRGEFDRESELFERSRERVRRCGLEELQVSFLLHEGMSLSDRRLHEAAALRFSEALAAAGDDAERRGAALMDLAIATDHLGDAARGEACFEEARRVLEGCENAPLRRCVLGNLASFHLDHRSEAKAEPLIEELLAEAEADGDRVGRLTALGARARLRLRMGDFAGASADRRAALELCERIEDRVQRAELEIEESDGRLFAGEPQEALRFARRAAGRPSDRGPADAHAAQRLADLERWIGSGDAAGAFSGEEIEAEFRRDPASAAERVARARAFFGEELERRHGPACARARAALVRMGRAGFAAAVFGSGEIDPTLIRTLCGLIRRRELPVRVCGAGGRELWRSASFRAAAWRRPLARGDPPVWIEGEGERPDLIAALFDALWVAEDDAPATAADGTGLEVCRRVGILSADASIEALGQRLVRIASQNVTVFVSGESGTGKERVARALHELSPRASRPFLPINIAAFPEHLLEDELFGHVRGAFTGADRDRAGLFEAADGGTLFLDEIGDLSPALQAKLLRVLQEHEIKRLGENRYRTVEVRVISATHRNLEKEVEGGRFREDLYYRLKVATLQLPPLRERGGDAVLLARHFLDQAAAEYSKGRLKFSAAAAAALRAYSWPGNVRQLQNAVLEAAALADPDSVIDVEGLSPILRPAPREDSSGNYRDRVDGFRRRIVSEALAAREGNRTHAARDLGLSRQALLYLIRELGIPG